MSKTAPWYGFVQTLLASFGQILLQNSPLCGGLVVIGVALSSATLLLGGVLGASVALLVARTLSVDDQAQRAGGYGFNGALAGFAVCHLYPPGAIIFGLIALLSGISTLLQWQWQRKAALAPYTAPYVISFWVLLLFLDPAHLPSPLPEEADLSAYKAILNSIAQICFQQNPLSGLLFLVGVLVCSPRAALWMLAAAALSLLCCWVLRLDNAAINSGLYGYNGVLVALGCLHSQGLGRLRVLPVLVPLTLLLWLLFQRLEIVPLTAPFVLTLWLAALIGVKGDTGRAAPRGRNLFRHNL